MKDNNLRLRTAGVGSLTATETSSTFTINETPINGLSICVHVPKRSAGDTMQVTLRHSTDNSTFTDLLVLDTVASIASASTVPVSQHGRFVTRAKYIRSDTTVAGTSPDFGAVVIDIGDYDFQNNLTVTAATNEFLG